MSNCSTCGDPFSCVQIDNDFYCQKCVRKTYARVACLQQKNMAGDRLADKLVEAATIVRNQMQEIIDSAASTKEMLRDE